MAQIGHRAQQFLQRFTETHARYKRAATELEAYLQEILRPVTVPIHAITARAKEVSSLRSKIRRKGYKNPASQVTDLVAVRVITYFSEHLDAVDEELRATLQINATRSRDVRRELPEDRFGYRSNHLVARLRPSAAADPKNGTLGRRWFEIQLRSILDHAWSEIEHEIVYKSGIEYPIDVRRRFKAVAGSLEVLEHAFSQLHAERSKLVDRYAAEFAMGAGRDHPFDAARLQAFLEIRQPLGLGWRKTQTTPEPLPPSTAAASVEALDGAKLNTVSKLASVMDTKQFRRAVNQFAALESLSVDAVSHLALAVLAVAVTKPRLLELQFPEMVETPSLSAVVAAL